MNDTIYALASGHGKAGVAVFRISGARAPEVLRELGGKADAKPRTATLIKLATPDGAPIDHALALTFPAPHSFTGEDVLELHTHGSRAVIELLLTTLHQLPGLRLAEPGEFARRAFANNKFDLLEAEGLVDLIDAETPAQHAQALRQLGGEMSARVANLRESVLIPLALLEAYIDFPDEEIPEETLAEVSDRVTTLTQEIRALLDDGQIGERIRDGIEIVIFGPPNAGKSSLLNALAKRDVAIVSAEPGTTRDLLEVHLNLDGYAVTLVDTAGIREAAGSIEAEGIRRAHHRLERSALKLALFDITIAQVDYAHFVPMIDNDTMVILTKSDLADTPHSLVFDTHLSTLTGDGMEHFISLLKDRIREKIPAAGGTPVITRARHRESFVAALAALDRFAIDAPLEICCEELRHAAAALGKITGKISTDDLLDVVFSRFCIGK